MATLAEILIGLGAGIILISSAITVSFFWNTAWQKIFPEAGHLAHDTTANINTRYYNSDGGLHHGDCGGHGGD